MMFTIGGCYPRGPAYATTRVDHYAPKPGKKLWIDFSTWNPPPYFAFYKNFWGYSGAIVAGSIDSVYPGLFTAENIWYALDRTKLWADYQTGLGKGVKYFWADEIVTHPQLPGLAGIASDMAQNHPEANLYVNDYSTLGGVIPPTCYWKYDELFYQANSLENNRGKPIGGIGCDKYWGQDCDDPIICDDVGNHWEYLRSIAGAAFNFAFIRACDNAHHDVDFNNANNYGLSHLIVYQGDWGSTYHLSDLAGSAWKYGWLAKFVEDGIQQDYRQYLGGDPSDPDSWGEVCSSSFSPTGPVYEVYH